MKLLKVQIEAFVPNFYCIHMFIIVYQKSKHMKTNIWKVIKFYVKLNKLFLCHTRNPIISPCLNLSASVDY